MKKNYFSMMFIAFGLFAFTSCNKEEQNNKEDETPLVTINLGIDQEATKAEFTDMEGLRWSAGDPVQIIRLNGVADGVEEMSAPVISNLSDDRYRASISATFVAGTGYAFRYRFNGTNEFVFNNNLIQSVAGTVPADNLHLHSGTVLETISSSEIDAGTTDRSMKIAGTILRFLPYTTMYNAESVKSVSIETSSYILGTVGYNYHTDGSFKDFGGGVFFWDGNRQQSGLVTLTTPFALTSATDKTTSSGIYLPIPAQAGTIHGYTIVVKTDAAIYEFTSAKDLEIKENVVKNIPLNLNKATNRIDLAAVTWPADARFYIHDIALDTETYPRTIKHNNPDDPTVTTLELGDNKHYPAGLQYTKVKVRSFEIVSRPAADVFALNPNMINCDFFADKGDFDLVFNVEADNYATRTYTLQVRRPAVKQFSVPTTVFGVAASATGINIPVTVKNVDWSVAITSDGTGSATFTKNDDSVDLSFPANTGAERSITVRISTADEDIATKVYDVTVTQGDASVLVLPGYQESANLWLPVDASADAHAFDKASQFGDVTFTAKTVSTSGIYSCSLTGGDTGAGDADGKFGVYPTTPIALNSGQSFAISATARMAVGVTGAYSQIVLYGLNGGDWKVIAQSDKVAFNGTPFTFSTLGTASATYSNIKVVAFVRASGRDNTIELKDIIFAKQ